MISHSYKTVVKPSPGKGRGVFARQALEKDETIEIAPILIIPEEDTDLVYASFLAEYWYETAPDSKSSFIALGHASLYNHDDNPNAAYEICLETKTISVSALADIKRGEEITISYGFHPLVSQYEDQVDSVLTELFALKKCAEKLGKTRLQQPIDTATKALANIFDDPEDLATRKFQQS